MREKKGNAMQDKLKVRRQLEIKSMNYTLTWHLAYIHEHTIRN